MNILLYAIYGIITIKVTVTKSKIWTKIKNIISLPYDLDWLAFFRIWKNWHSNFFMIAEFSLSLII